MNNKIIIECQQIVKTYDDGLNKVSVLKALDLTVYQGELLAIIGQSGSGKSTLLHILGALDNPSSGKVIIDGTDIHKLSAKKQGEFRNKYLGFVYQFHHLLSEFSSLENVAMPLLLRGNTPKVASAKAKKIIDRVGLSHRLEHKPGELSGGERQRIALARALVTEPSCVFADEPTGNLDHKTADATYNLMLELNKSLDTSFVIVTHDIQLAKRMDRTLNLSEGSLHSV